MLDDLANTGHLHVPRRVVETTWRELRRYGAQGYEGFVLWLGHVLGNLAMVEVAFVPPQESIRGEDGVGYFVNSNTLFQLNRELHRTGLRLLAQVHSHPTEAYHSSTDDAYAVVTTEGGFSVVVPDFARGEPLAGTCAIYCLRLGKWVELRPSEVRSVMDWEMS